LQLAGVSGAAQSLDPPLLLPLLDPLVDPELDPELEPLEEPELEPLDPPAPELEPLDEPELDAPDEPELEPELDAPEDPELPLLLPLDDDVDPPELPLDDELDPPLEPLELEELELPELLDPLELPLDDEDEELELPLEELCPFSLLDCGLTGESVPAGSSPWPPTAHAVGPATRKTRVVRSARRFMAPPCSRPVSVQRRAGDDSRLDQRDWNVARPRVSQPSRGARGGPGRVPRGLGEGARGGAAKPQRHKGFWGGRGGWSMTAAAPEGWQPRDGWPCSRCGRNRRRSRECRPTCSASSTA
jgi:hypothetical protein